MYYNITFLQVFYLFIYLLFIIFLQVFYLYFDCIGLCFRVNGNVHKING